MAFFRGRGQSERSPGAERPATRLLPETEPQANLMPVGVPEGNKIVVTIARQCGSGGSEIGRILAQRGNLHYLDHEIIDEVAQRSGMAVTQIERQDEQTTGPLNYALEAMNTSTPFTLNYSKLLQGQKLNVQTTTHEHAYLHLTRRVILEMASAGDAVIIGRGSQFLLRGLPRVLHVYIFAPLPRRIENVMQHFHLSRQRALEFIERRDTATENYLRYSYGSNGTQPELYHLLLNTGLFSFEMAADLIVQALPLAKEIK
ncbi:MAG TPA: cytidylate kinase-like family protein [Ktedonobacteraceae bacterium]|nr:cytidylate kinase-like family protein [Ktedonobacteraceae bacterium]